MRIAHVSDIHIRNFRFRSEYEEAFDDLYEKLEVLKPDLIINTGDTVHSKLAVSPELFDDVAYHFLKMSQEAPHFVILGNHDLNLKNKGRMDAISPIVRALQGRTDNLLQLLPAGRVFIPFHLRCKWDIGTNVEFWNFDIRGHQEFDVDPTKINIGLYHGSISGCMTDLGYVMEEGEAEISKFDKMDYVLLGDIHKRQSFRGGRMQYPGSLIQQNYGEELTKGFLLWDIRGKDDFEVTFHEVKAPGRFYTIRVPDDLDFSLIKVPPNSRIQALVDGALSPSKRWEIEKAILDTYDPIEVIVPDSSDDRSSEGGVIGNLVGSREELITKYLQERGLDEQAIERVRALFHHHEEAIEDGPARGTTWRLRKIAWDDMMNYGEENAIDLTKARGLVGIFAPNASGKSSIFDILLQAAFDKTTKEVPKNIDLINDNKNVGKMCLEFESGGKEYKIERQIERISYGQRKLSETKQWGKTSLEFSCNEGSLNGTTRPETERQIREIIGSFDDFVLTTMISQNPIFGVPGGADILNCKETDRRKILFRFLDLDVYEKIERAVKDELKELVGKLKSSDTEKMTSALAELVLQRKTAQDLIAEKKEALANVERDLEAKKSILDAAEASDIVKLVGEEHELGIKIKALENRVLNVEISLGDCIEDIENLVQEREKHLQDKPSIPPIDLEDLADRIQVIRKRLEATDRELLQKSIRLSDGTRSLVVLSEVPCEGKYPTCKFISGAVDFSSERDVIAQAVKELTGQLQNDRDELEGLEQHEVVHKRVLAWEKRLTDLDLSIANLRTEEANLSAKKSQVDDELSKVKQRKTEVDDQLQASSVEHIVKLREIKADLEIQARDLRNLIETNIKGLGGIEAKMEKIQEDLESLNGLKAKVSDREALAEMCGKNGLPYRILTLALPVINAEIAKILSGIVKFNVFFEDDPEEQTVSLFIRYGNFKRRPLALGSGAEKFISSVAIRAALLSVSSLPKTDILIIDEGFGKLDPEHLEAFNKMFEYLKRSFGTVFIVSHVDSMRDIVDHSIDIINRDGYAHVDMT